MSLDRTVKGELQYLQDILLQLKELDLNIEQLLQLPSAYVNDAAADADTSLLSGKFYTITGDRTIYIKP